MFKNKRNIWNATWTYLWQNVSIAEYSQTVEWIDRLSLKQREEIDNETVEVVLRTIIEVSRESGERVEDDKIVEFDKIVGNRYWRDLSTLYWDFAEQ